MLLYCYDLLTQRQDILAGWQKKFQYILVDEFQDINKVQYEIVRMLAGKGDHLFIVGDDDQPSIVSVGPGRKSCLDLKKIIPMRKK